MQMNICFKNIVTVIPQVESTKCSSVFISAKRTHWWNNWNNFCGMHSNSVTLAGFSQMCRLCQVCISFRIYGEYSPQYECNEFQHHEAMQSSDMFNTFITMTECNKVLGWNNDSFCDRLKGVSKSLLSSVVLGEVFFMY